MTYTPATKLTEIPAKYRRLSMIQSIVDAIGDGQLSKHEIFEQTNIARPALDQGHLAELCRHGVLEKVRRGEDRRQIAFIVTDREAVADLKADMMGESQACD